jgi:hypothetical protein
MRLSLRSLVTDLEIRARVAKAALEQGPDVGERTVDAIASFDHAGSEAKRLLGENLDSAPDDFYPTYQHLTQSVFERETFELPFLLHYDDAAARATALCSALLENVSWPFEPMLLGTFSSQYYWTLSAWRVISLPCGEERRLLGIGDLCHELGHTVYAQGDQQLVNDFPISLGVHLRGQLDSPAIPDGADSFDYLTDVFFSWQEAWLQEFVCDLIATYLVGPAFPRQHARLRAMTQPLSPIYELKPGSSHPADDARMQACLAHISKFGFEDDAAQLRKIWDEIVAASGERRPAAYDIFYPTPLLEELAETVADGCVKLGLRPYSPDADPLTDIPRLANTAWDRLEVKPDGYEQWEAETVSRLWETWNV